MALTPTPQPNANRSSELPVGKSLEDIAELMAANRARNAIVADEDENEDQTSPNEVAEYDVEDEAEEEEELEGEVVEEEDEDADGDANDGEEEEVSGSEDADFEIDDDTLFEVEGFEEPISFARLKEVYKADETIRNRIDEITASHQEIQETRNTALYETSMLRDAMSEVVKQIDTVITQPLVSVPTQQLKDADPARYIAQMEAYQKDQARIEQSRQLVLDAMNEFSKQHKENENNRRVYEISRLTEKLPDLKVDGKKKAVMQDIVDAADTYGFTPEELNQGSDHRLFHMAYEAMQYRKLKKGMKLNDMEEREEKARTKIKSGPRLLRSKGTTAKKLSTAAAKRVKVVKNRAQSTGKVDDVANFLTTRRQAGS